jgi:hypothetical protein
MPRPGVTVELAANAPTGAPVLDSGQAFFTGVAERGPGRAVKVQSITEYEAAFGARSGGSLLYDSVGAYFAEGGAVLYVSRISGATAVSATGGRAVHRHRGQPRRVGQQHQGPLRTALRARRVPPGRRRLQQRRRGAVPRVPGDQPAVRGHVVGEPATTSGWSTPPGRGRKLAAVSLTGGSATTPSTPPASAPRSPGSVRARAGAGRRARPHDHRRADRAARPRQHHPPRRPVGRARQPGRARARRGRRDRPADPAAKYAALFAPWATTPAPPRA